MRQQFKDWLLAGGAGMWLGSTAAYCDLHQLSGAIGALLLIAWLYYKDK